MSLPLYVDQTFVVLVELGPEGLTLSYVEARRAAQGAFPISLSMPLTSAQWAAPSVVPWLMNVLPEGEPLRARDPCAERGG